MSKERWLSLSKPERHAAATSTSSVYIIVTSPFETHPLIILRWFLPILETVLDTKAFPYIIALGLAWGLNLVASRFGIGQFDPFIWIALRLIIAVAAFTLFYAVSPTRSWSRDPIVWRDAGLVGVFATAIPLFGFVLALQYQSAGLTALFVTTSPAITITVAHFGLEEAKLNRMTIIGILVALSGALLIIARGETGLPDVSAANPLGPLLIFGALFSEALVAVFIRRRMQSYDAFDVTSIRLLSAMLVAVPLALYLRPVDFSRVNLTGWGALLFAAIISTFIAQLLSFYITRTFGTTAFAVVGYVVPIVAIVGGVVMLGETITFGMVGGMALIVVGILIVNKR
ncbi:MAG: DMT family transporter [Candidatus Promineifilaceae bacterium]